MQSKNFFNKKRIKFSTLFNKKVKACCNSKIIPILIAIVIRFLFTSIAPGKTPLCAAPLNFPLGMSLEASNFGNWAQQIELSQVWTVTPRRPEDVVTVANWALENDFNLRAVGFSHNWSPLVVTGNEGPCSRVILIDTTKYFTEMEMVDNGPNGKAVRVGTGVSMNNLLEFLEENEFGILSHPAPDITVGGVVAVGGHGGGVPMEGQLGNSGTISNLVISLNVVVWDEGSGSFGIQTFQRSDPEMRALMVNLGRIFMTEVTLEVSPLVNLRCISRLDISADTLFADPRAHGTWESALATFVAESGTVEVIWFPFTTNPWLKVWTVSPTKPFLSSYTTHPYNYPFSDNIPLAMSDTASRLVTGQEDLTSIYTNLKLTLIGTGLATTLSYDLWGPSKNVLLYVKPTTLRLTANGYALLTSRDNLQLVLHQFTTFYNQLIQTFAAQHMYPINGPLEIRIGGIDTGMAGFGPPCLSVIKPVPGHPEFDTTIWFDSMSFPNSPHVTDFLFQVEEYLRRNLTMSKVLVRPEWSKGFAYTSDAAWANTEFLEDFIPKVFGTEDWNFAVGVFKQLDPRQVFTNEFLRKLFN